MLQYLQLHVNKKKTRVIYTVQHKFVLYQHLKHLTLQKPDVSDQNLTLLDKVATCIFVTFTPIYICTLICVQFLLNPTHILTSEYLVS